MTGAALEIALLGPTRVSVGGEAVALRPREKQLLTAIAVDHPRSVSIEDLIDRLWPDGAPGAAKASVQNHVARVRTSLGRDAIETDAGGSYRLGDRWSVDVAQMDASLALARERLSFDDYAAAADALRSALAHVRGELAADLDDAIEFDIDRMRRQAVTLAAEDDLLTCLVAVGDPRATAVEAHAMAEAEPYRELRWAVLALALYRDGRRRDALEALATGRAGLRTTSGLDAGPALQALEARILADDPTLIVGPLTGRPPATSSAVRIVGRTGEWSATTRALDQALVDCAQLVIIEGEPGIGKSTLCGALTHFAGGAGWRTVSASCVEPGLAPSLWPVLELARALLATNPTAPPTNVLGEWVSSGVQPQHPPSATELADQLVEILDADAGRPTLVVVDDAQWADAATLAVLTLVVKSLRERPVVVVIATRPPASGPDLPLAAMLSSLVRAAPATRVTMAALAVEVVSELIEVTTNVAPSRLVAERVHARSGGNPLFVVELARWELEHVGAADRDVPVGIRDAVRHRLARLETDVVAVLHVAAVLGERFDVGLLIAAAAVARERCIEALGAASDAHIVESGGSEFRFIHAVVRDAVIADIRQAELADLHGRVADALTERFGDSPDVAEPVAHHRLLAVPLGDAIDAAWAAVRASNVARWRSSLESAALFADKALDALQHVVRTPALVAVETAALQARANHALRSGGKAALAPLAEWMFEFGRRSGSDAATSIGLLLEWTASDHSSNLDEFEPVFHRARRLAERAADPYVIATLRYVMGSRGVLRGDLRRGLDDLDRAVAAVMPDPDEQPRPATLSVPLAEAAFAAATLGLADDARMYTYRRLPAWLGDRGVVDRSAATTIAFACAIVEALLGQPDAVLGVLGDGELLDDIAVVEQMHDRGEVLFGWALACRGDVSGAERAVRALTRASASTELVFRPMFETFCGAALERAGDARAIGVLADARRLSETRGERWWLAETIRLQAVAERRFGCADRAEALWREAAALATEQGALTVLARIRADGVDGGHDAARADDPSQPTNRASESVRGT